MTHLSASSETREQEGENGDLELPADAGFVSLPPRVSLETMMQRIRQLRLWFPEGLPSEEDRWQSKVAAEFQL